MNELLVFIQTKYNLRRNSLQIAPIKNNKNDQWRNSFFIRTPRVWNTLPDCVVKSPNAATFKNNIRKIDFSNFVTLPLNR